MQPGVKHHSNAIRELQSWLSAQKCFPLFRGMLGGSQLPLTRAPQNPGTNSPFPVRAAPPPPPPKKSLKKQNTLLVMDTRSKTVNLVEVNITELLNTHKILWPQSYQLLSLCILEHHLMVLFCCCETVSTMYPWLAWNFMQTRLASTHRHPPASASCVGIIGAYHQDWPQTVYSLNQRKRCSSL